MQCLDCMHDQPHLTFADGRIEAVEDRWERMVTGTPWVAWDGIHEDIDLFSVTATFPLFALQLLAGGG